MENGRELAQWLLPVLDLQSRSLCISWSRRGGENGDVAQFGKRDPSHRCCLGKHKVCSFWHPDRSQGISTTGPDIFSGAQAILRRLPRRSSYSLDWVHLSELEALQFCPAPAQSFFSRDSAGLYDCKCDHFCRSLLSSCAQAGGIFRQFAGGCSRCDDMHHHLWTEPG